MTQKKTLEEIVKSINTTLDRMEKNLDKTYHNLDLLNNDFKEQMEELKEEALL